MSALKRALMDIEDDLVVVEASAGVLHMAFANLEARGQGGSALAQSLWFAAKGIEDAAANIRDMLGSNVEEEQPPARHAMHWGGEV